MVRAIALLECDRINYNYSAGFAQIYDLGHFLTLLAALSSIGVSVAYRKYRY